MLIALSGDSPVTAAAATAPRSSPVALPAPSAADRVTAPDTVTISAAGRQAMGDADHDGDSH